MLFLFDVSIKETLVFYNYIKLDKTENENGLLVKPVNYIFVI